MAVLYEACNIVKQVAGWVASENNVMSDPVEEPTTVATWYEHDIKSEQAVFREDTFSTFIMDEIHISSLHIGRVY